MSTVLINDITLRDGEQMPGVNFFPKEKLQIATLLYEMGIPIIEAGFAGSSQSDSDAISLIAQELGAEKTLTICSMARGNYDDIDQAARSLEKAAKSRIQVVIPTSDIHIFSRLKTNKDFIKELTDKMVSYARNYAHEVEFAAEDSTRSDTPFLEEVCRIAVKAGASTIELPDTVGCCTPIEYANVVKHIHNALSDKTIISTHCHNDLGLATANTLAGIQAGAKQIEVTINGIGERAGNASTEEVVVSLLLKKEIYKEQININTKLIKNISNLVYKLSHSPAPHNKAIVGKNIFRHESGIHQHGILCDSRNYQFIEPEFVGHQGIELVLGKSTGRHALGHKIKELGFSISKKELDEIWKQFKRFAEESKMVNTNDLKKIVNDFKLTSLKEKT